MLNYYTDEREENAIKVWAEGKLRGISKLFKNKRVLIAEGQRKEIFLVSEELYDAYKKIKKQKHPFSIGFYFGEYSGKELKFGLETLDRYAKISDYHKVVINRKFEQKFLYGRNVSSVSVISYDESLEEGDLVVVCNSLNEALGMGTVVGNLKSKKKTRVIKNLNDRGWFLRHNE